MVLSPKVDEGLLICADYRCINAATARDSYPMARMDDCIDSLGKVLFLTALDTKYRYWNIPIWRKDISLTEFTTYDDIYEYLRMLFGLRNARAMSTALST